MAKRKGLKISVGLRLDPHLMERLRNAVYWIGQGLSITSIIEVGTLKELERLEKKHNQEKPFQPRKNV